MVRDARVKVDLFLLFMLFKLVPFNCMIALMLNPQIYKGCIEYLLQLPDTTNPLEVSVVFEVDSAFECYLAFAKKQLYLLLTI